jgi:hypothetical protein
MILSKHEQQFLVALDGYDGPMPVQWLKPKYQALIPRMRQLGLIYKRDPGWAQLTKLGRSLLDRT